MLEQCSIVLGQCSIMLGQCSIVLGQCSIMLGHCSIMLGHAVQTLRLFTDFRHGLLVPARLVDFGKISLYFHLPHSVVVEV